MIRKQIAERICALAEERQISIYKLAQKVPDLCRATVYNAAQGEGSMEVETLDFILSALEITPKEFFDWDDDERIHLSNDEKLVIEDMRMIHEKGRQRLVGYAEALKDEILTGNETSIEEVE
ncbi:MAG: helix-turn-helix domain-containing protein [Lachnospiraceae bacterium]|nr:helix-turn-helix domain-containing protein [Lachnospiraceae bacterium]